MKPINFTICTYFKDELSPILSNEVEPKILLTHSDRVSPRTVGFCKELARVSSERHFRK